MTAKPRLALIAHDARKAALVAWATRHRAALAGCALVATGTTGGQLQAALPELAVERVKSGPLGGDQQIGAKVAEGEIDFILKCVAADLSAFQTFLTDDLTAAKNVAHVKTSLIVRTTKQEPGVPVPPR